MDWWDFVFRLKHKLHGIVCFFVGHDETTGNYLSYQPDYCDRCFIERPQDEMTMLHILSRVYHWFVDRQWSWFDRLDDWLLENYSQRLPRWWEY